MKLSPKFQRLYRTLLQPPVALGALGLAGLLFFGAFLLLWVTTPPQQPPGLPTALLAVTPGPTATPLIPTPTATVIATEPPDASPLPGEIGVGSYVQIVNTGGAGLNLRRSPGLSAAINFLGYDSEVFEVRAGPEQADGLTWWYVVTPVDEARNGWAVSDFLSLVAVP